MLATKLFFHATRLKIEEAVGGRIETCVSVHGINRSKHPSLLPVAATYCMCMQLHGGPEEEGEEEEEKIKDLSVLCAKSKSLANPCYELSLVYIELFIAVAIGAIWLFTKSGKRTAAAGGQIEHITSMQVVDLDKIKHLKIQEVLKYNFGSYSELCLH